MILKKQKRHVIIYNRKKKKKNYNMWIDDFCERDAKFRNNVE